MCLFYIILVGKAKGTIISVSEVDGKITFKSSLAAQLVRQQQNMKPSAKLSFLVVNT